RKEEKKKGNEGEEQLTATDGYGPTAIPMMNPIDVNKVTVGITEVTGVANNTGNGSSVNPTTTTGPSSPTSVGQESVVKDTPTSYAAKLSLTSLTKANLRKLDANVPNGADYHVWLPLALIHDENDRMKNSLYGYYIVKRLAFPVVEWFVRNNWKKYGLKKVTLVKGFFPFKLPSTEGVDSVLRDELSRVPTWVKFHDFSLVAYTSDGLSLIATIIGTPMMLDSYTNSMCLKSLGRSSYARILIKIDVSNGFSDNLVMAVPNLEGPGYTKETIRVEYEWEPPRCSTDVSGKFPERGLCLRLCFASKSAIVEIRLHSSQNKRTWSFCERGCSAITIKLYQFLAETPQPCIYPVQQLIEKEECMSGSSGV
ncbi:hypothetical protein Tco_0847369, partial [Tanacetum coccineum]